MSSIHLQAQAKNHLAKRPEIRPGYTVRVHEKIKEGDKERVQIFEGLVVAVHGGHVPTDATFTVRKIVSGVGVEKLFALHSPTVEKVEVKKVAKVRRAKLYFLRGLQGKAARLQERFTTAGEFKDAVTASMEEQRDEAVIVEAPAEETAETDVVAEAPAEVAAEPEVVAEAAPAAEEASQPEEKKE